MMGLQFCSEIASCLLEGAWSLLRSENEYPSKKIINMEYFQFIFLGKLSFKCYNYLEYDSYCYIWCEHECRSKYPFNCFIYQHVLVAQGYSSGKKPLRSYRCSANRLGHQTSSADVICPLTECSLVPAGLAGCDWLFCFASRFGPLRLVALLC